MSHNLIGALVIVPLLWTWAGVLLWDTVRRERKAA
jgi:hypothetical protein